jgi:copper chaperone NosL
MDRVLTRRELVRLLGLGVLAVACRRAPVLPAPEDVVLGRDECAWCRMLIDDARLPAEFARMGGRVEKFGEPGCLLAWLAEHRDADGVSYVTVEDGGWLRADAAAFVVGGSRTPMSFDITAHRAAPAGAASVEWADLLREGAPRVRPS